MKQLKLLKGQKHAYGGELLKTRAGRSGPRPLATKHTMHLVMRSSQAVGPLSFWQKENKQKIKWTVAKFARKYGVQIISMVNVGNHLHFHIKLTNRFTYKPFIRAISGAIAMAITGKSRWKKVEGKFWDYRPYTRVVIGYKAFLGLRDYIRINQLEGCVGREHAQLIIKGDEEIERLLAESG